MTGGELINRLYEEVMLGGFVDAEIIHSDVLELLKNIGIPEKYRRDIIITEAEILKGESGNGGFSRKQLAEWGVPWPPPKGWRKELIRQAREAEATALGADRGVEG